MANQSSNDDDGCCRDESIEVATLQDLSHLLQSQLTKLHSQSSLRRQIQKAIGVLDSAISLMYDGEEAALFLPKFLSQKTAMELKHVMVIVQEKKLSESKSFNRLISGVWRFSMREREKEKERAVELMKEIEMFRLHDHDVLKDVKSGQHCL